MIRVYYTKVQEHESVEAHELLAKLLRQEYGIYEPELCTGLMGKPYLRSGPFFSISHSKGIAAVAFSEHPIGLDLEQERTVGKNVPLRVMSPEEYRSYCEHGCNVEDFLTLWTLKEAYFKYLGTGLHGGLNRTTFYYDSGWKLKASRCVFQVFRDKKMFTALCSCEQEKIIRTFL